MLNCGNLIASTKSAPKIYMRVKKNELKVLEIGCF